MTVNIRTGHIKVVDPHGNYHWLAKTTEVIDVTFPNGSTGATSGATHYLLYGRTVIDLGNGLFDVSGAIYKRV